MVQYVLAAASAAVLLVCGLVLWSSAEGALDVEVRYIGPAAPGERATALPDAKLVAEVPSPSVANVSASRARQQPHVASVHPFFAPRAMIIVTSAATRAAARAPFPHRIPIGAPRLGAALALTPDAETRWSGTFAMLDGAQTALRP